MSFGSMLSTFWWGCTHSGRHECANKICQADGAPQTLLAYSEDAVLAIRGVQDGGEDLDYHKEGLGRRARYSKRRYRVQI